MRVTTAGASVALNFLTGSDPLRARTRVGLSGALRTGDGLDMGCGLHRGDSVRASARWCVGGVHVCVGDNAKQCDVSHAPWLVC